MTPLFIPGTFGGGNIQFTLSHFVYINCCVKNRLIFIRIPIYVGNSKHTDSYDRVRVENGFQKPVSDGCESF
jgi:hypothetical protein